MSVSAVNAQPLMPLQPAIVEEHEVLAPETKAKVEEMHRVMYKLIKLMAELQSHLLDLNKELNIQKSDATKEMMKAYKDSAKALHMQAMFTAGGLAGSGGLTTYVSVKQVADMSIVANIVSSFGQIGSDIAKKYPESTARIADGMQRKFEQLSQELGQTAQSNTSVLDGISDKLQGAMRNAAPAA